MHKEAVYFSYLILECVRSTLYPVLGSLFIQIFLFSTMCLRKFVGLAVRLCVYLSVYVRLFTYLFIFLSICLSICHFICLFYLFVCLYIFLLIYLSTYLSNGLPIYLSIYSINHYNFIKSCQQNSRPL